MIQNKTLSQKKRSGLLVNVSIQKGILSSGTQIQMLLVTVKQTENNGFQKMDKATKVVEKQWNLKPYKTLYPKKNFMVNNQKKTMKQGFRTQQNSTLKKEFCHALKEAG